RRIATTILPPGSLCDLAQCSKPVKLETTILIYRHLPWPIQTEFQLRGLAPTATLVRWNAVVQFLSIFEVRRDVGLFAFVANLSMVQFYAGFLIWRRGWIRTLVGWPLFLFYSWVRLAYFKSCLCFRRSNHRQTASARPTATTIPSIARIHGDGKSFQPISSVRPLGKADEP